MRYKFHSLILCLVFGCGYSNQESPVQKEMIFDAKSTLITIESLKPNSEELKEEKFKGMTLFTSADSIAFFLDQKEVSVADFHRFVIESKYVPVANQYFKINIDGKDSLMKPGSTVFYSPKKEETNSSWWKFTNGADYLHLKGNKRIELKDSALPAVHISYYDALAFCIYRGKRLPTDAEFEFASEKANPIKISNMNIWQGNFPVQNSKIDGFEGLAPVNSFNPDKNGLYHLHGNVWEWVSTKDPEDSMKYRLKGGSFLCSENYCRGWLLGAFNSATPESSFENVGFRCACDARN